MTAPAIMNGKTKVFEEIFRSPFEQETESDALKVLQSIRECHDEANGWVEIIARAEQLPNGKWRAFRHHAKYR